jgi:hypothetical protein
VVAAHPSGVPTTTAWDLQAYHPVRLGERWVLAGAATASGVFTPALVDFDPDVPAFSAVALPFGIDARMEESTWAPAVVDDELYLIDVRGATAVVRCDYATGALSLAAFHNAPFLTRDLRAASPWLNVGNGLLGLVHDRVDWGGGTATDLYRFLRCDRSFQITHLSHPFRLHENQCDRAGGLALDDDTLAMARTVDGQELCIASLDLADALALLQPVWILAPDGAHAFSMPSGLLAGLQRWTPPPATAASDPDLDGLPVLRAEAVIEKLQGGTACSLAGAGSNPG